MQPGCIALFACAEFTPVPVSAGVFLFLSRTINVIAMPVKLSQVERRVMAAVLFCNKITTVRPRVQFPAA